MHAQRRIKHTMVAAVVAATTVLIGDMLNPRHQGSHHRSSAGGHRQGHGARHAHQDRPSWQERETHRHHGRGRGHG
jgi:hypothetical protein